MDNAADAQYCINCGEALAIAPAGRIASKAENGWVGAGIGCVSYIALLVVLYAALLMPAVVGLIPPASVAAQTTISAIVIILFLAAVVMLAVRNHRRSGWLTGFLIVLLLPLGLFGACVGILTLSRPNFH